MSCNIYDKYKISFFILKFINILFLVFVIVIENSIIEGKKYMFWFKGRVFMNKCYV